MFGWIVVPCFAILLLFTSGILWAAVSASPKEPPKPACTPNCVKVCELQGKEFDKEIEIDGVTHCVCKDLVCY